MRVTREDVIHLIESLPEDKLASVYDFASYIQSRTDALMEEEDRLASELFGDATEEQLRAEDEKWDQLFADTEDKLLKLAEEAEEAYRTGQTTGIDDSGDELKPVP
jgi:recombinational DNA repair protein (RecF pathway)